MKNSFEKFVAFMLTFIMTVAGIGFLPIIPPEEVLASTPTARPVRMVAAGDVHTVAVLQDGTLWTWGTGVEGALGRGTISPSAAPAQVGTDNDWMYVAAGTHHTLAIRENGSLWAWGANSVGQLGVGDNANRNTPALVCGEYTWTSVDAGISHTVALRQDGTVWSWGANSLGQLGGGTNLGRNVPAQIISLSNVSAIAAGGNHSAAISSGYLYTWGDDTSGQLGRPAAANVPSHVGVNGTIFYGWASVALGLGHTMALMGDVIYPWGYGGDGRLGSGLTGNINPPVTSSFIAGTQAAAGTTHSLLINHNDYLYATGSNFFGQLGIILTTAEYTATPVLVCNEYTWISVATGTFHSFGIRDDYSLWAWGRNEESQLGVGDAFNRTTPERVAFPAAPPTATLTLTETVTITDTDITATITLGGTATGAITLGTTALPAGVAVTVDPATGVITITGTRPTPPAAAITGVFPLTVTRQGVARTINVNVNLTPLAAAITPTLTLSTETVTITDTSLTATITVGGTATGAISVTNLPAGITAVPDIATGIITITGTRPAVPPAITGPATFNVERGGIIRTVTVHRHLTPLAPHPTETETVTDTVTETETAFQISLSPSGNQTFPSAIVGYAPIPPRTITVTNTGTSATGPLEVFIYPFVLPPAQPTFILEVAGGFISNILPGASTTFTIRPRDGLPVGTHTASVRLVSEEINQSFNLSFTVLAQEDTDTDTDIDPDPGALTITPRIVNITDANLTQAVILGGTATGPFSISEGWQFADYIAFIPNQAAGSLTIVGRRPSPGSEAVSGHFYAEVTRGSESQSFRININLTPIDPTRCIITGEYPCECAPVYHGHIRVTFAAGGGGGIGAAHANRYDTQHAPSRYLQSGAIINPSLHPDFGLWFWAAPNSGYRVSEWRVNGALHHSTSNYIFLDPPLQRNLHVTVRFQRTGEPTWPSGGVTFAYPHFPWSINVSFYDSVSFQVQAHLTEYGRARAHTLRFEWLRNGAPWHGAGSSGTIPVSTFRERGFTYFHLMLPARTAHYWRGGTWAVRVTLWDTAGNIIYVDTSRSATLTVDGGLTPWHTPRPTPTPWPTPSPFPTTPPPPPVEPVIFPTDDELPPPPPFTPLPTPAPILPPPPPTSAAMLAGVTDTASAVAVTRAYFNMLSSAERNSGLTELFAETAIQHAASVYVSGGFVFVSHTNLQEPLQKAAQTRYAIERLFEELGHEQQRDLRQNVSFVVSGTPSARVRFDPSVAAANTDYIWVRTPYLSAAFSAEFIRNNAAATPEIEINSGGAGMLLPTLEVPALDIPVEISPNPNWVLPRVVNIGVRSVLSVSAGARGGGRSYTISFNRPVSEPVYISVPPAPGQPDYQVLRNTVTGENMGGRRNPVTGHLTARIRESGHYIVVENRVDFGDVQHLSAEMQRAIRQLAAQGIAGGIRPGEFEPNQPISRAQIAAMYTRMLGLYDAGAAAAFNDVARSDWFFGAVGSAYRHGLMTGTAARTFSPHMHIPKDQLVTISARILRSQMGYRDVVSPLSLLRAAYHDYGYLAEWSHSHIALATRHNLVIPRADGNFAPDSIMTRGEAALMLHRLYLRLF